MRKLSFFLILCLLASTGALLASTMMCGPMALDYWTGSTDGESKTRVSEVAGYNTEDGWFMFDISGIPADATINAVEFHGYVNDTSYPYWSMTPLTCNPDTATPEELYSDIIAEQEAGYYLYQNENSSYATGWKVHDLGAQAVADLQAKLADGWFAMGMSSRDDDMSYYIVFDGWNEASPPYLVVDFSVAGGPDAPTLASPTNGAFDLPTDSVDLVCTFGANTFYYDVYFDTVNPPVVKVLEDQGMDRAVVYTAMELDPATTYYWRVVAKDASGTTRLEAASDVWSFRTVPAQVIATDYLETFNELPGAPMPGDWLFGGTQSWELYDNNGDNCICASFWTYDIPDYWVAMTPLFDLSAIPFFSVDWSHAYSSSYPMDRVVVEITTDAGANWTTLFDKIGMELNSYDGAASQAPGSFKTETFDLTGFSGNARIRVVAFSGYGPDLFIDNPHLIVPQTPVAGEVYISEVSDNLVGMPDDTGYIELYNKAIYPVDLSGCMVSVGVDDGGTFAPYPVPPYVFPAGTVVMPQTYLTLTNGASAAAFEAAWGLDPGMNIVACDVDLQIVNGDWAYQLDNAVVRAELDHTLNIAANGAIVQQEIGVWVPSTPAESTPGDYSPGQTLPVELSSFAAVLTVSNTVMIEWATQSETDALGYHVLRGESDDLTVAEYITDSMINAANSSQEMAYSVEDIDVEKGQTYYYWLETFDTDGTSDRFGPVMCAVPTQGGEEPPASYEVTMIGQNYPNPFNPTTTISYSISGAADTAVRAELAIYNVRGQRVRTLFSGPQDPCEIKTIEWNGDDDAGQPVGSGVYFYKLTTPTFSEIHKMMLLK